MTIEKLRNWWPMIVFALTMTAAAGAAHYRIAHLEDERKSESKKLDEVREQQRAIDERTKMMLDEMRDQSKTLQQILIRQGR